MTAVQPRAYHHGDLRRILIEVAGELLQAGGEEALSLRAVARRAGVSPSAPYKHFTDKSELLEALSERGFADLAQEMERAFQASAPGRERVVAIGAAYVAFALRHRALYRVMIDTGRDREQLPPEGASRTTVTQMMWSAVAEASPSQVGERDVRLASLGIWSALHGLVDLYSFRTVQALLDSVGGEEPFLQSVLLRLTSLVGPGAGG
jgi:AcrR family transcriptional regulator